MYEKGHYWNSDKHRQDVRIPVMSKHMDDNATLDKLGNWTQFNNNGDVQDRSHNAVNEITSITPDQALTYDENGNMTFHKDKNYVWDANNRLTHVYNMEEPVPLQNSKSDGLNENRPSDKSHSRKMTE
jgi:hypothetical protein